MREKLPKAEPMTRCRNMNLGDLKRAIAEMEAQGATDKTMLMDRWCGTYIQAYGYYKPTDLISFLFDRPSVT